MQIRSLIHALLVRIGRAHPQALMYPLLVACKSQSPSRRAAAYSVLEAVRTHSAVLVEQAQLVSQELIRIAILWQEMWHEALEEASRLYFGESNVEGMLGVLLPLHEMMDKQGPATLKEIAFVQAYGRELSEVGGRAHTRRPGPRHALNKQGAGLLRGARGPATGRIDATWALAVCLAATGACADGALQRAVRPPTNAAVRHPAVAAAAAAAGTRVADEVHGQPQGGGAPPGLVRGWPCVGVLGAGDPLQATRYSGRCDLLDP